MQLIQTYDIEILLTIYLYFNVIWVFVILKDMITFAKI